MPRHPFAVIQHVRASLSTDNLTARLRHENRAEDVPPVPPLPVGAHTRNSSLPPPPGRSATPTPVSRPNLNVDVPAAASRASPGHFVKHSSRFTLLLSGQEGGVSMPEYTNGGTIDGILAVPRPSGLLALEVTIEGVMKLQEVAGAGTHQSDILKDSLFTWNSERNASFPAKVTFRYTLPTHYTHRLTGERYRLPPTYDAHLSGIPGFRVEVHYAIVVTISRTREKSDWWRKNTKLRVPFRYRELSRPSQSGPFPLSLTKTPTGPKTLFKFTLQSRRSRRENIDVQMFLPASQVCTLREPIPFFVTLFGNNDALEPFGSYRPAPTSFHPLSSINSSSSSLQQQLINRTGNHSCPVLVQLQRQTQINVIAVDMPSMREKTYIAGTKTLARGTVHASTKSLNSITWSGSVALSPSLRNGGFVGSGIKVTDSIVLTIVPPDTAQSRFMQFCESVPLRLTTEAYDCYSAAVTISEWQ